MKVGHVHELHVSSLQSAFQAPAWLGLQLRIVLDAIGLIHQPLV